MQCAIFHVMQFLCAQIQAENAEIRTEAFYVDSFGLHQSSVPALTLPVLLKCWAIWIANTKFNDGHVIHSCQAFFRSSFRKILPLIFIAISLQSIETKRKVNLLVKNTNGTYWYINYWGSSWTRPSDEPFHCSMLSGISALIRSSSHAVQQWQQRVTTACAKHEYSLKLPGQTNSTFNRTWYLMSHRSLS